MVEIEPKSPMLKNLIQGLPVDTIKSFGKVEANSAGGIV
uniref:Uncharacterized protein n=1 Tax=Peronospora matthiolae TaxID=2874970 RepID=A0AAV1V4Y3_9STRA